MYKTIEDLYSENEIKMNAILRQEEAFLTSLFSEYPKLEELFDKRQNLLVDALGEVVKTPRLGKEIRQKVDAQIAEIDNEIAHYYRDNRIPPFEIEGICTVCDGKGTVEGGMCICIKERMYQEVFGGEDYAVQEGSFSAYNTAVFPEENGQRKVMGQLQQLLQKYAEDYPSNEKKQLVFMGDAGLGKSFAAIALLKEIAKKEKDICYISAFALFTYLHKYRLGEVSVVDPLYEVVVLAIDDLGSEPITQNVTREMLFDILVNRKKNGLHTIVLTNNTPEQLKERYTERVSSRLFAKSDSLTLPFKGSDIRLL